jgi:hypothetical protein
MSHNRPSNSGNSTSYYEGEEFRRNFIEELIENEASKAKLFRGVRKVMKEAGYIPIFVIHHLISDDYPPESIIEFYEILKTDSLRKDSMSTWNIDEAQELIEYMILTYDGVEDEVEGSYLDQEKKSNVYKIIIDIHNTFSLPKVLQLSRTRKRFMKCFPEMSNLLNPTRPLGFNGKKAVNTVRKTVATGRYFKTECRNDETNFGGVPWEKIPQIRRWGPIDGYCYDLEEVAKIIYDSYQKGIWPVYPFTKKKIPQPTILEIVDIVQKNNIAHHPLISFMSYAVEKGYLPLRMNARANSSQATAKFDYKSKAYQLFIGLAQEFEE